MNRRQQGLRERGAMLGLLLLAVLLSALVRAEPAAAQCGTAGTNTKCGTGALTHIMAGIDNSAFGFNALANNIGAENTASGANALFNNTTGNGNTASGYVAVYSNTTGVENTASGAKRFFTIVLRKRPHSPDNVTGDKPRAW